MGISAIYRKNRSYKKANDRLSSLRMEFDNVKEESFYEDDWIKAKLNADDADLDDMIPENER
ncbi:MAG TPA: hypothetical protein VHO92_10170 [Methanobacterium sp.]|nr:hypothetical protein [Methanobacterium sp.]